MLITILLFTACTKEVVEESYISYTGPDGKENRFTGNRVEPGATSDGVYGERYGPYSSPFRFLYMIRGFDGANSILFIVEADSLGPAKYSNDHLLRVSLSRDTTHYSSWPPAVKPFAMTISRHSNGAISGTFEGKLYIYATTPLPTDSIAVTGKINNVYLRYK